MKGGQSWRVGCRYGTLILERMTVNYLNVVQRDRLDSVCETWLPEDLEIRVSDAEKRSHLRQESSFATLHSSFEELFESTP